MQTHFIEATGRIAGPDSAFGNWGKFMVARFDGEEWRRPSHEPEASKLHMSLLNQVGWSSGHVFVTDLQTGEGAIFSPHGYAHADLEKHSIWVCPLFEPFLTWLYTQDLSDLDKLPGHIELPYAEFAMAGYRRPGPQPEVDKP